MKIGKEITKMLLKMAFSLLAVTMLIQCNENKFELTRIFEGKTDTFKFPVLIKYRIDQMKLHKAVGSKYWCSTETKGNKILRKEYTSPFLEREFRALPDTIVVSGYSISQIENLNLMFEYDAILLSVTDCWKNR